MGRRIGIDLGTSSARASIVEGGRPVVIAGPVSGSPSQMLAQLKQAAEAHLGEPVTGAVVSVPTAFGDTQWRAAYLACESVGLPVVRLVAETSLAGLAFGYRDGGERTILVTDLGAGTFGAAVIEIGEGVVEVRSSAGDNELGGRAWDRRIVDYWLERLGAGSGVDAPTAQHLLAAAERARIELSSVNATTVTLPNIPVPGRMPVLLEEQLSRVEVQRLTHDLTDRCRTIVDRAVSRAGLSIGDIDQVVLVGNATRTPAFAAMIGELTGGREPFRGWDLGEAVVSGAALLAAALEGTVRDIMMLDVIPASLGIVTGKNVFITLIERNTTYPTKRVETFTTTVDNQTTAHIRIYQSGQVPADGYQRLGVIEVNGIPPAPRGTARIEVEFDIEANGRTVVTAREESTGRKHALTVLGDPYPLPYEITGEYGQIEPYGDQAEKDRKAEARSARAQPTPPPSQSVPQASRSTPEAKPAGSSSGRTAYVVWAAIFGLFAAVMLFLNVPNLSRTITPENPTCAGQVMHAGDVCRRTGGSVGFQELNAEEMTRSETKGAHNAAKAGTIFGSISAGVAILLLVGARRRS
ncbi:Hsp70 family protein [Nocardia sp. NPDC059240]|uniref:Hsp70 family protein n=1 Tax=Nocardia sp. NPDC059240 TaxID=3346786 RepID=UPI003680BC42